MSTRKRSCSLIKQENTRDPLLDDEKEFTVVRRGQPPAGLQIEIRSFSKYHKHESQEFFAEGFKWKLVIYPNGDENEDAGDHISIYLTMVGASEVTAEPRIFLYEQISKNFLCFQGKMQSFHPLIPKWGIPKLISKKSLRDPSNGYLVDDKCVLGAEVIVHKKKQVFERVSAPREGGPYKHEFTISNFSKCQDCWTSDEFSVGCYRWKLLLYPNGDSRVQGRIVSFYLECVDARSFSLHQKLKTEYLLRIKNKLYDTHRTKKYSWLFTSFEQHWGGGNHEFMSNADMRDPNKGFLVDDRCDLEVEFYGPIVEIWENSSSGNC